SSLFLHVGFDDRHAAIRARIAAPTATTSRPLARANTAAAAALQHPRIQEGAAVAEAETRRAARDTAATTAGQEAAGCARRGLARTGGACAATDDRRRTRTTVRAGLAARYADTLELRVAAVTGAAFADRDRGSVGPEHSRPVGDLHDPAATT